MRRGPGRRPAAGAESLSMIVLGIDPGLANTGYGVVARRDGRLVALDGGVIETRPGDAAEHRLADIHAALDALLPEHAPDAMALEELYFGQNVRTAFAVGQARGVGDAGGRPAPGCRARSYTPQQVKAAVCGSGRARQGAGRAHGQGAARRLPRAAAPDHAADALAVAICHANHAPLRSALAGASG